MTFTILNRVVSVNMVAMMYFITVCNSLLSYITSVSDPNGGCTSIDVQTICIVIYVWRYAKRYPRSLREVYTQINIHLNNMQLYNVCIGPQIL